MLLVLFFIPLLWGAVSLLRAASAYGVPDCPGIQLDEVGEEHPGPFRHGHMCKLYYGNDTDHSIGTSTYEQLKVAQGLKRRSLYRQGVLFTLYGVAGTGAVIAATSKRKSAAASALERHLLTLSPLLRADRRAGPRQLRSRRR